MSMSDAPMGQSGRPAISQRPVPAAADASRPFTRHSGSVAVKINSEVVLLLGWTRAILLQLAHPLVASGIADHSSFKTANIARLHHTLKAMIALTFGTPEEVKRAADNINDIHDRVHGKLRESAGLFPAGTEYSAHDSRLLAWVHATLLDSFLDTYELYVGPLTLEEKDRYCLEASSIEPLLGISTGHLPRSLAELNRYMDEMFESGELVVTETARVVARNVVSLPVWWVIRPLLWLFNLPGIGSLPTAIRQAYGFRWVWWHQASLRFSALLLRTLLRFVPSIFRHWPEASRFWFAILAGIEKGQAVKWPVILSIPRSAAGK